MRALNWAVLDMFYRWAPLLSLILLLFLSVSCKSTSTTKTSDLVGEVHLRPMNLVVVTIDTLRPDHLHCYGYPNIETPALDSIAQGGVLFENAVAQTPLTPPSHASIFTGQYPNVHHVRNTGGFILRSSARPLARILQEHGWDTAAFIGSAVLKKVFGFNNGFDVYDDQMPKPGNGQEFGEDPERRATEVVKRAVQWLSARSPNKPYFLWVHVYDPHLPYQPPEPFRQRYKARPYDGEIAYTDQQLGRLFAAIDKQSSPANTITAVLSDHGESLSEHGEFTHGVFLYDATSRIAFLMKGPGLPAGTRVKQQARSIDFLPTVLELMGGKANSDVQGVSLTAAIAGKSDGTEISYGETLYPKMNMGWAELRAIRTNHWKYIRAPKAELYDLGQDPDELVNVIDKHPQEVQKFEAHLKRLASPKDGIEKVESSLVDEKVADQLKSLGYLSGFSPRNYELNGQGADPKDRIGVLKLIDFAENPVERISVAKRIAALEKALQLDPGNPSIYYQLGGKLEKGGRYADALKLYRAGLDRGIQSGRLHSRIADLSLRAGDKATAITEYEKAAQFNPTDVDAQTNLATAYLEQGRPAEAQRVFDWILKTDPAHAAAYNGLGLVAVQKRDMPAARGYFERAVQLDGDLVEAHMNLGIIYQMTGDRVRARSSFEAFLAKASPAQYGQIIPRVRQELAALQ
jgi:arylsulfatase A-like enzyme/Flp pilus assembly protein TadD